ncbi:hypothetical protein pb186bvf_013611 [Paramecium bursaria]
MKYINLNFENKQLEKEFQLEILKQAKKGFLQYQLITILVNTLLVVDQIIKQNVVVVLWFSAIELTIGTFVYISYRWPTILNYVQYYYYNLDFFIGLLQICYHEFSFLNIKQNDIQIYQDILLQFFLIYHSRYNYLGSALMFINFISIRVYIQMSNGYSTASMAYLCSGLYFIIQQYQQEKNRRKLFLKSQRNKQLELLIEEFIDDQVSIIEKDEQNVRFKTIIINNKLSKLADQFNLFLKDLKLSYQKEQLLNYLYQTTKSREILICKHQQQTYQITYQTFQLRKIQIFLKIKPVDQQIRKIFNFKDLYKQIIQTVQFKPCKLYKGKKVMQTLYLKSFYQQFSKYYQFYQVDLEQVSEKFLMYLFSLNKLKWVANDFTISFHSDKKLLFILVFLIKRIIRTDILYIKIDQQMLQIDFNVSNKISQNYLTQINKILYHVGYFQLRKSITKQTRISLILLDCRGLEKIYQ